MMLKISKYMVDQIVIILKKKDNKKIKISKRFEKNMKIEKKYELHKFSCYQKFSKKVKESRKKTKKIIR